MENKKQYRSQINRRKIFKNLGKRIFIADSQKYKLKLLLKDFSINYIVLNKSHLCGSQIYKLYEKKTYVFQQFGDRSNL